MGLGMWLLDKTFEKATEARADKKQAKRLAEEKQIIQAKNELANKELQIAKEKQKIEEERRKLAEVRLSHSEYDVRLLCAEVAICAYIIYADDQVSEAEKGLINSFFENIFSEYGPEVHAKAVQAYKNSKKNFINVQDYIRKIRLKDIKLYLQAAEEISEVDGVDESETKAIQRIKDYIEQLETGSAQSLVCPSCGGVMNIDDYGYKATCASCGREVVVEPANAPSSAYREVNRPKVITDPKPETAPVKNETANNQSAKKKKAGKVALKVALGVMTGGVSLIPDAVIAVKKKADSNKEDK